MGRRFILKGDKTDHNGVVLDGIDGSSFDGRPSTCLGARVFCHTCNTEGVVVGDGSLRTIAAMGKQVALENDLCQCKCEPLPRLVVSRTTGTVSF